MNNKTTNCNIKNEKCEVYCGRGQGNYNDPFLCPIEANGWLGNPVAIGRKCPICEQTHKDGGSTLPCYEAYLISRLATDSDFRTAFHKLKGKKLGCFCKPNPCHTDVMIKYLDN